MSWYSFCTGKLDFLSDEDSHRFTSGYVYTLSGFLASTATKEVFWLMGGSLGYID